MTIELNGEPLELEPQATIAAVLGFGGLAGDAAGIAKILFFAFLVIAALSFLFGRRTIV